MGWVASVVVRMMMLTHRHLKSMARCHRMVMGRDNLKGIAQSAQLESKHTWRKRSRGMALTISGNWREGRKKKAREAHQTYPAAKRQSRDAERDAIGGFLSSVTSYLCPPLSATPTTPPFSFQLPSERVATAYLICLKQKW